MTFDGDTFVNVFVLLLCFCPFLVFWGMLEALRHPREIRTGGVLEVLKQLLLILGDLFLIPYYTLFGRVPNEIHVSKGGKATKLAAAVTALDDYTPTPWLRNTWVCWLYYFGMDVMSCVLFPKWYTSLTRREILQLPEGGCVGLDWYPSTKKLAANAPILLIFPGLLCDGRGLSVRPIMRHFADAGWRCVTFVDRGAGFQPLRLENWQLPRIVGWSDKEYGLQEVRRQFPQAPICLMGMSAGTSFVRKYLTVRGPQADCSAAVVCDGAWDVQNTLKLIDQTNPFVSFVYGFNFLGLIRELASREKLPDCFSGEKIPRIAKITDVVSHYLARAAGFEIEEVDEYYAIHEDKGKSLPQTTAKPLFFMVTNKDGLGPSSFWNDFDPIRTITDRSENVIVCISNVGTHLFRPQGFFARRNWLAEASLQFLSAALDQVQ